MVALIWTTPGALAGSRTARAKTGVGREPAAGASQWSHSRLTLIRTTRQVNLSDSGHGRSSLELEEMAWGGLQHGGLS